MGRFAMLTLDGSIKCGVDGGGADVDGSAAGSAAGAAAAFVLVAMPRRAAR